MGGPVNQGVAVKAEHPVAEGKVGAALEGGGKIGQGGAQAFHILGRQHHAVQALGQGVQAGNRHEFPVELQLQAAGQCGAVPRGVDRQPDLLGVLVGLLCQLELLELTVTGIHKVPRWTSLYFWFLRPNRARMGAVSFQQELDSTAS